MATPAGAAFNVEDDMHQKSLLGDPPEIRVNSRDLGQLDRLLSDWTKNYEKREIMMMLGNAGVPASATFDTMELSTAPHLRKRGVFRGEPFRL